MTRTAALVLAISSCSPTLEAPRDLQSLAFRFEQTEHDFDTSASELLVSITGATCAVPSATLSVREGENERRLTLTPAASEGGLSFTLRRGAFEPETASCDAERQLEISASISCDGGEPVTVDGTLLVREHRDAVLVRTPYDVRQGHFFSRFWSTPRDASWEHDGDTLTAHEDSSAPPRLTVTNARAALEAPVEVNGDMHAFLAIEAPGVQRLAVPTLSGDVVMLREAHVLAIPLSARGTIDATSLAVLRAPAPIVDLAFLGGTLYVLSQDENTVVLSRFTEAPFVASAPIVADVTEVLPYSEAKGFAVSAASKLVVMAANTDDGAFELYDPVAQQKENGGDGENPCAGLSPVPIPYPSPSSGAGGGNGNGGGTSSSIPMSNGDEAGTTKGGGTGPGCAKDFIPFSKVVFPARDRLTTPDGRYVWTGAFAKARGRLALVFESTDTPLVHRVLLMNVVTDRTTWLVFRTQDGERTEARVERIMLAPDGQGFVVSGGRHYDVFNLDGTWISGEPALPASCGLVRDVTIDNNGRVRVRFAL